MHVLTRVIDAMGLISVTGSMLNGSRKRSDRKAATTDAKIRERCRKSNSIHYNLKTCKTRVGYLSGDTVSLLLFNKVEL